MPINFNLYIFSYRIWNLLTVTSGNPESFVCHISFKVGSILLLMTGVFGEVVNSEHQLHWITENVLLLWRCGAFEPIYNLLRSTCNWMEPGEYICYSSSDAGMKSPRQDHNRWWRSNAAPPFSTSCSSLNRLIDANKISVRPLVPADNSVS